MLSIKTHNILDYVIGAALMMAPFLFGFSEIPLGRDAFLVAGFALVGYSLLTDYRYSLAKIIPLGAHMGFDIATGLFVGLAPWIYGYADELTSFQVGVHAAFGAGAIALVAFTRRDGQMRSIPLVEEPEISERPIKRAA
jgi:hypothetical protein